MSKSTNLVVVESPAKAATLEKYLGKDFMVLASYGHVKDLVPKEGAVETNNGFLMHYEIIAKNAKHVDAIMKAAKTSKVLYLATDPDREGEAISWHIQELIRQKIKADKLEIKRVAFFEITKTAVKNAIANPRDLNMNLVHAQQARRALDYLVGFKLSPLLWKKVRKGLSAGRVQSPALRMIVEREEEIQAFKTKEYWSIEADCLKTKKFKAKLIILNAEKLKQFSITDANSANEAKNLILSTGNTLLVDKIVNNIRKKYAAPPFTTSTLQQEAARKLGFSASKTMRVAQQLYEGVNIGDGEVGLITYMRTDSLNLSNEAVNDIRNFISKKYGEKNVPDQAIFYKTKSKNAQEAHEAIRPTMFTAEPILIKAHLSSDQFKLYDLIWKRTIACQMIHATYNQQAVDLLAGTVAIFRANGSVIDKPGFIQVYQEGKDDNQDTEDEENLLPNMQKGDVVKLNQVITLQHFTEPPPRFTEATIVKNLEEHGIGRPSTYASIISTLQQREYVVLESKRFSPTDVGIIVNKFLSKYFTKYVDYGFTAALEDLLDQVATGDKQTIPLLEEFWGPFKALIKETEDNVQRKDITQELLDEKCPECNSQLAECLGKRGKFIGCTAYPECKYTKSLLSEKDQALEKQIGESSCPDCNAPLLLRVGKYGSFIGCSAYPACKHIESLQKPEDTGVFCPLCKSNNLFKRKSKYGKFFYACSGYPKCNYAVQYPPKAQACENCHWPVMMAKPIKNGGEMLVCPQKDCVKEKNEKSS